MFKTQDGSVMINTVEKPNICENQRLAQKYLMSFTCIYIGGKGTNGIIRLLSDLFKVFTLFFNNTLLKKVRLSSYLTCKQGTRGDC